MTLAEVNMAEATSARPEMRRPVARYIVCVAILVLGWVAAGRLSLSYLPSWSFPELQVSLQLPEASELGAVTRRWIEPLEASVRSTGQVRSMAGEVDGRGGSLRVRFASGIDIQRKAARLESELGGLRRQLPRGARLDVSPRSQGDGESSMILWLPRGEDSNRFDAALLQRLQRLPEVREVTVAGRPPQQLRIRTATSHVDAEALESVLKATAEGHRLGELRSDGRSLSVWRRASWSRDGEVARLADRHLPVGLTLRPLSALATVDVTQRDAAWIAHREGRPGWVLFVQRELGVSPLSLERNLLRTLRDLDIEPAFFLNEAEPLRDLLERLLMGAGISVLALVLGGLLLSGWRGALAYGLALPVALAAVLNAYSLFAIPLDVTTLPVMVIAMAGSLLFLILRHGRRLWLVLGTQLAATALLPVAIALASGTLAPLLRAPGKAYGVAVVASLASLWLLPMPKPAAMPGMWWRVLFKRLLRQGWTVLLLALTWTYLWFVLAGGVLSPRPGGVPAALMDLAVYLQLPDGSTMEQATRQVRAIEEHLDRMEEVESHWSIFNRQGATLGINLQPEARSLNRLRPLRRRLHGELGHLGAAVSVVPFAGSGRQSSEPMRFDASLEDKPEFDVDEAHSYRFILRSTDLEALRRDHEQVLELIRKRHFEVWPELIRSEWREPTIRAELVPRPGVSFSDLQRGTEAVRRLVAPRNATPLEADGTLELRVLDLDSPEEEDDVPLRSRLMSLQTSGDPLVTSRIFRLREELASPGIRRQGARFVLPVSLRLRGSVEGLRRDNAKGIHHQLRRFPTSAGVDLEVPDIGSRTMRQEQMRMWSMALALPALMWVLGACRLNSLLLASAGLLPSAVALASATPWLSAVKNHVDEMTLLGLAAASVACLPAALEVAGRLPLGGPLPAGAAYRWLTHRAPVVVALTLGGTLLLAAPTLGMDGDRHPWVLPLRGAAVVFLVAPLVSYAVLPLLLRGLHRLKIRDVAEEAELRQPIPWQQDGELTFSVQRLTKIYDGGFKAIDQLGFDLRPGIIGLLGPNGAGKTTLLRLLCGLLEPTRGQISFRGVPITPANLPEYRRLVGFLPQEFNAYDGITARSFLDYWAIERGMADPKRRQEDVDKVLADVGLSEMADRKVRQFSGGMRRRMGIARALLGDPPIVIVDEPTTGLDVESRNRLRETLLSVAGERIIIFSTHIASDVAAAASRILLLQEGKLLFDGAAEGLLDSASGRVFETVLSDGELRSFSHTYRVTTRVRTEQGIRVRAVMFGDQPLAGNLVKPNLEEAYLAWLGDQGVGKGQGDSQRSVSLLDVEAWKNP